MKIIFSFQIFLQCAQILLVMRPSEEAPSDFQDYTLVAVVAVATYLGQYPMGEQHGVPTLARRYGQDASALEQVFEYIIASVNNYRETYMRMQALQEEGALDDDDSWEKSPLDSSRRSHPTRGLMDAMSDLDGFAAKLNAILQADLHAAAVAAGPLEIQPISVVGHLDAPSATELEASFAKIKSIQEQVAMLDRIQNIRVKNIQDEYQRFMERVRAKAQSAIDHANTTYSQQRSVLMSRFDALVNAISKDHPVKAKQVPIPHSAPVNNSEAHIPPGKNQDLPTGVAMNPMNMLSHSMASQILAMQANMAAAAAAAGSGRQNTAQQANLAAAFANQPYAFAQMFGQVTEADMKAQLEQLEALSKSTGVAEPVSAAMVQAAGVNASSAPTVSMPPVTLAAGVLNSGIPPRHPEIQGTADTEDRTDVDHRSDEQHMPSPGDGTEGAGQKQVANASHEERSNAQQEGHENSLPPNQEDDSAGSKSKDEVPREKSLMETLMEDFDPDLEILPDSKVADLSRDPHQGLTENNASHQALGTQGSPDIDKDDRDQVARVPSLSGWMPSQQSPAKKQSNTELLPVVETKQEPDTDVNNNKTDN